MEQSFSLEFNPLMNVKSVKDYEQEITRLRSENFELKAKLTHVSERDNLPKILYEQNEHFARLEQARNELAKQNEELQQKIEMILQEKAKIEARYNADIITGNERTSMLEDENKRLLLRLERTNKELMEYEGFRGRFKELDELNNEYKAYIQNEEKKHEQERFEYARQVEILQNRINELMGEEDRKTADKSKEIMSLRQLLEAEVNKNKNNLLIITDLKKTIKQEVDEKRERLNEAERKIHSYNELIQKQQREGRIYQGGMEKFGSILSEKLENVRKKLAHISESVIQLENACNISADNQRFLERAKIKTREPNGIVTSLKSIIGDTHRKLEVLKREARDATFFAENSKKQHAARTMKVLEDFRVQFAAAKEELLECRRYLEKKASENKELKNENSKLKRELSTSKNCYGLAGSLGASKFLRH